MPSIKEEIYDMLADIIYIKFIRDYNKFDDLKDKPKKFRYTRLS